LIARALTVVSGVIARAQARGEVKAGDPRAYAFRPESRRVLLGVIWRETFEPVGADPIDLPALAGQHVETVLTGMLAAGARP